MESIQRHLSPTSASLPHKEMSAPESFPSPNKNRGVPSLRLLTQWTEQSCAMHAGQRASPADHLVFYSMRYMRDHWSHSDGCNLTSTKKSLCLFCKWMLLNARFTFSGLICSGSDAH